MKAVPRIARESILAVVPHVAPRFASAALFLVIGHLVGVEAAGIFALGTAYLLILTTVTRGLDELIIREVSRQPERAGHFLVNFSVLRLVFGVGLFVLVVWLVQNVFLYTSASAYPVLVLALSSVPDGLAYVAQAVLNGQRHFGWPALTVGLLSTMKLAGGAIVLWQGQGLLAASLVWLAGSAIAMLMLVGVALWRVGGLRGHYLNDWTPVTSNAWPALSFLALTLLLAFESQTDTLVLSKVRSEAEIGWYGAATTVAFSLLTLSQAYRFAVYPLMARYAQQSPELLSEFYRNSMRLIAASALPLTAGLLVIAPQIVQLLFGPSFANSAPPLRILCFALLFMFMNEPNSRMMLVRDRQRQSLILLASVTLINVVLNLLLTPALGIIGAAVSRVGSTLVLFAGYTYYVAKYIAPLDPWHLVRRSVLATIIMTIVIYPLRDLSVLLIVVAAMASYVTSLFVVDRDLLLWIFGAWRPSRAGNTSN